MGVALAVWEGVWELLAVLEGDTPMDKEAVGEREGVLLPDTVPLGVPDPLPVLVAVGEGVPLPELEVEAVPLEDKDWEGV